MSHAEKTIELSQDRDGRPEDRLDIAERTLPRRKFFDDMPDKGLFAAVAFVGFIGIMLLKHYNVLNAELIAGLAVAVMILYGYVSFHMPAVQLRPDRLGDNFYYLGFIYTLASLSAALVQLRFSPQIEDLLGNFGIALVTTVVGVAGRVLFVQMRGDIDEVEERVRRDLVSASADLRAQLVIALREFETFHAGVIQATEEAVTSASEHVEAQIRQIGKVADAAIQEVNSKTLASDVRAEKLSQILTKINDALSELPLMGSIELPNERLKNEIKGFSSELELLVVELRNTVLELRQLNQRRPTWYWPFRSRRNN